MMRKIPLLVAAVLTAAPVLAAEPYEGRWAGDISWCENKKSKTDQVPFTITKKGIEGYESNCPFTEVTKDGNLWIAAAECSGEGETWIETTRMSVAGNVLTLTYDDGTEIELVRCK